MAITINGTEITTNRLNSSNITLESVNGTKVYPSGYWELVLTGSVINFPSAGHYWDGTNNSGNRNPKPRVAFALNGSTYFINTFGTAWLNAGQPVPFTGPLPLPPEPPNSYGLYYLTNGQLYRWVES